MIVFIKAIVNFANLFLTEDDLALILNILKVHSALFKESSVFRGGIKECQTILKRLDSLVCALVIFFKPFLQRFNVQPRNPALRILIESHLNHILFAQFRQNPVNIIIE